MRLRFLPLAGLLLAAATTHAQQLGQEGAAAQANLNSLTMGAPSVTPTATSEGTIGTPYAIPRWLPAHITLSNNLPLAAVPLKYDVLGHRLLMRPVNRPNDSLVLDDRLVMRFVLDEPASGPYPARQHLYRRFTESPLTTQRADYVEVLHEGRYTLLKHPLKNLKKASLNGAYNSGDRHDEIEDKAEYFLRTPEANLVPIKLGLKPLQNAAPALATALKQAADAQKPKTEADWAAVLNAADPAPAK